MFEFLLPDHQRSIPVPIRYYRKNTAILAVNMYFLCHFVNFIQERTDRMDPGGFLLQEGSGPLYSLYQTLCSLI